MKSRKKRWYVAALIVQVTVQGREEKRPLYDRQIRLLRASNHGEAYAKALALGEEETQSYVNPKGEKVGWRFLGLSNLDLVGENSISDGLEIYSTLQRGNAKKEVRRKKALSIFWYEANKHKKLAELMSASQWRYAPAFLEGKPKQKSF